MFTKKKARQNKQTKRKMYSSSPIAMIDKIYRNLDNENRSDEENYQGHQITYGEMEIHGLESLYKHLIKELEIKGIDSFMDIGSGKGKLCYLMSLKPEIKSILGIELVKSRHELATNIVINAKYKKKVTLLNENFLDKNVNIKDFFDLHSCKRVFVWMSNLCFDKSVTNNIIDKLILQIPSGSILCCSKEYTNHTTNLQQLGQVDIPMSWNQGGSQVHIYEIKNNNSIM
jgi:SAM-dependent methyltransferase